jgi:DNA-binding MarR family transcriptional regulator
LKLSYRKETGILQEFTVNFYGYPDLRSVDHQLIYSLVEVSEVDVHLSANAFVLFLIAGSSVGLGGIYLYRRYQIAKAYPDFSELSDIQKSTVNSLFYDRNDMYSVLLGYKITDKKSTQKRIREQIPTDLKEFKFLLHPVRLTVMKLLFDNMAMSVLELRNLLNLTNNQINNTIKELLRKNYVETHPQFIGDGPKKLVILSDYGIDQFKKLVDQLHLFLDITDSLLDVYPKNGLDFQK